MESFELPGAGTDRPVDEPATADRPAGWVWPENGPSIGRGPRPPRPPSTFRTALVAALLSAVLTAGACYVIFRGTAPGSTAGGAPAGSALVLSSPAAGSTAEAPPPTGSPGAARADASLKANPGSAGSVEAIAAQAIPPVVMITTTSTQVGGFFGERAFQQTGVGSGIVIDGSGLILTNAHVVEGADSISVQLSSGRQLSGRVYGVSSTMDLAVVKVDGSGLPVASIGTSRSLRVGEPVVAIGTPLGEYPDSVTTGVVSGLDRSIDIQGTSLTGLIQTDAPINPGNSGGPLLDPAGNVVGVNTATTADAQGVSFAIPIDAARDVLAAALAGQPIP